MSSFVIDKKNLDNHQDCFVVENCKFFPYPEASCDGKSGKICDEKNLELPQPDRMLLAVVKSNFDGASVKLRINVVFNAPETKSPQPPQPPKSPQTSQTPTNTNLQTPTVTP